MATCKESLHVRNYGADVHRKIIMLYKNKYRVESARLQSWDYSSPGSYFITICTHGREHFFGAIKNGKMILSEIGKIAERYWREIPDHFSTVRLDEFIVMPNHVHGIIIIEKTATGETDPMNEQKRGIGGGIGRDKALPCLYRTNKTNGITPPTRFQNQGRGTISAIVGSYKSICTKSIHKIDGNIQFAWQPRFYDVIIRTDDDFYRIKQYIKNNPSTWDDDDLHSLEKRVAICFVSHKIEIMRRKQRNR